MACLFSRSILYLFNPSLSDKRPSFVCSFIFFSVLSVPGKS